MRNSLERFVNEYQNATHEVFAEHPLGDLVRNTIPEELYSTGLFESVEYKITGSVGQGNWAKVPWIGIFDTKITATATKGVYIVYLLSSDSSRLYLTFNQGCTEIKNNHSKKETVKILRDKAKEIAELIDSRGFNIDENINLGNNLTDLGFYYQKGTIFYKEYKQGEMPTEGELLSDLSKMKEIYADYVSITTGKSIDWWPSLSEYDPGISKEQWLDLLNDGTTFTDNALSAFAAMYDFGGTATCVQLENQYGKTSDFYRMAMGVHVPDKIHKKLGIPFCVEDEKEWLWPIPFVGRSAGKDEPGKYVWKLRSELYDALEEFDITRFLSNKGTEKPMPSLSTKEIIETIKKYIASKGFTYEDGVIENFYLSLKSKPFVILAGTSGTGKSKLVELFAEAIGAEYLPVAVRPDWSDSSDLFGHLNLNGKYVKGAIFDFIYEAQSNPWKPYILCMDEMNLARVEYYLSDFLSIIETRKDVDGSITTKPLVSDANYGEDNDTRGKYGELVFPENLYLVGTVNMDETTFPFSKKVLDRANTIEFDYVDLLPPEENVSETVDALEVSNDFLKTKYLLLNQCKDRDYIEDICLQLEDLNKDLRLANAHVGYRVRDEIAFYMLNNKEAELLSEDEAFDYEIMQKILPRIQGSASSIKKMMFELYEYCYGSQSNINVDARDIGKTMRNLAPNAKYKLSAAKIGFMMERYEEDGFTSYWL